MFICKNNTTHQASKSAFTLIELLVVIVIIGILATLATVALSSARANARDARRISDLKQISTGLELYYADYSAYPSIVTFGSALVGANSKTYMAKVPTNPTPRAEGACGDMEYQYTGNASDYSLIGCLAKASGDAVAGARKIEKGGVARDLGPTGGLVGWWLLEDLYTSDTTIRDISGNGNDGTNSGATLTTNQLGQANKAYAWDKTSKYISIPVSVLNGDYTMSIWAKRVYADETTNTTLFSVNYEVATNLKGFCRLYFTRATGTVNIQQRNDSTYILNSWTNSAPQNDTWNFYTVVFTKSTEITELFVNGVGKGGLSSAGAFPIDTGTIRVGMHLATNTYYNGSLSDFRIYNRTLSQGEVAALYDATR